MRYTVHSITKKARNGVGSYIPTLLCAVGDPIYRMSIGHCTGIIFLQIEMKTNPLVGVLKLGIRNALYGKVRIEI